MTEPGRDPILAYLREHAGRYRVAALRQRLLQGGYDPAAVDRAVQAFQTENPPGLRQLVWEKTWRALRVNACLLGAGVAIAFAPGVDGEEIALALVAILCAELLGGLVLIFPRKRRALGLALLAGALLSMALGIFFLWARMHLRW
jgi:hypothetical protein